MSTYVYGIIRASHPSLRDDLDGIGDPPRPVRVLRQGELAAIVSDAPISCGPNAVICSPTRGHWPKP